MAFKKKSEFMEEGEVITPKYPLVNFLEKRLIRLAPVAGEVFSGVPYEKLPDGFIVQGSGRSLERGRFAHNGYFKPLFDDSKKVITPQYPEEPMTELEFFVRASGQPLDSDMFWTGYNRRNGEVDKKTPYTVHLPSDGKTFDLSEVKDNIDYRVVKSHTGKYIAPSWEERNYRPTYMFALVDEKISTDRKKEAIELKLKATSEFNKIKDSRELLAEFLIIYNGEATPSQSTSTEWLFNEVYKIMENNPSLFLSTTEDPSKDTKILVYKALRAGALKRKSKKYFTLGDQPLGTLAETITYFKNPDNFEFVEKIKYQVETYNKPIV